MNQEPSDSEYSALTDVSKSLAHKYVDLKESYNQDIRQQVTTKNIKKSPTSEGYCAESVCRIQFPICDLYFSNNISIPPHQSQQEEN